MSSDTEVFRNLVARIELGDEAAETEVVLRFSQRVFVMGYARTRDREAARELVQEVLMSVIGSLRKGQLHDPDKLAAFVHGTARNFINNRLRSESRRPRLESIPDDLPQASMLEQVEGTERMQLVRQAMQGLGEQDRRILWMTLAEGRKPGEIAVVLGLTAEVVRTRKLRTLRKVTNVIHEKLSRKGQTCHIVRKER